MKKCIVGLNIKKNLKIDHYHSHLCGGYAITEEALFMEDIAGTATR